MKEIIFVRHGKSSWKHDLTDIDRPLNNRGKKDAPYMGAYMRANNVYPDLVLSSPAIRALTTARIIAGEIGYPVKDILVNNSLYTFTLNTQKYITEHIQTLDNQYNRVMIFGHNPTFTELANYLAGDLVFTNVPTCGIVAFSFATEKWQTINANNANLTWYAFPKLLRHNRT